ncbi:MAG TPA: phage tail sheath C-terminal domain-containing protein [Rubrobacteraceae bacterium]|nr:phage tail sheath C-terminal domain-containing protein [Rubrobacteraceae bacterium]
MPTTPTYPGVYIEEIPSGVRTISGVATSVAAFVDLFARGPMNRAVQIFNMGDFEREFGGLDARSEASYGISQFFLNGGGEAWVVRVASSDNQNPLQKATTVLRNGVGGNAAGAITISAASEGRWGNALRARVDAGPDDTFDLTLTEYATEDGIERPARTETHRGLSMNPSSPREVERVVNEESDLVSVARGASTSPPLQNGTISEAFAGDVSFTGSATARSVRVTIGTTEARAEFERPTGVTSVPLAVAARMLETAIRTARPADPTFAGASVSAVGDRLRVLAGPGALPGARITFAATTDTPADSNTHTDLKLSGTNVAANVQEYALGLTEAVDNTAQAGGAVGGDGLPPNGQALIGSENLKTGIHALEDVDLFNLLCVPRAAVGELSPSEAQAVMTVAEAYCAKRRAFFIADAPNGGEEPEEIRAWLAGNNNLRHRNAALYYPRLRIPDPLDEFRPRSVGASGTIAGLYARTDNERGVWKAPAGTDAVLRGVSELEYRLTDSQNGALNPLAINCLRTFPVFGTVCWGARTLDGSDQKASEWKYVPVRRLALYLEESLYRGTKWAVFEPNDEPLWAQLRLNTGAFMQTLFRQGAFQGASPREAYFVRCDNETTTQNDINLGVVNIVVGFAPLKPAEFVVIRLQQMAGQVEA